MPKINRSDIESADPSGRAV